MPKDFDESKIGFSVGKYGSTNNANINYYVSDNIISGYYYNGLNKKEGLTIRLELPEGYFVKQPIDVKNYITIVILILFVIITILMVLIDKYKNKVVDTVEFYPPKGLNSLEVGYIYKGKAINRDVTSLLIYLANKGYLKIKKVKNELNDNDLNSYKIVKLKDYKDIEDINEKAFLTGLFGYSNKNNEKIEISINSLIGFYETNKEILENINGKQKKKINVMRIIIAIMATISAFLLFDTKIFVFLLFYAVLFYIIAILIETKGLHTFTNNKTMNKICIIFCILMSSLGMFYAISNLDYILLEIIIYIYFLTFPVCYGLIPNKISYSKEIIGKVKGFRNYLQTAEKEKLESMVEDNPNYFYDILPYAYVLGITDKWIKKFENITIPDPTWCEGFVNFDILTIEGFMHETISSIETSMSTDTSSGGGISGGGSGGGGGGSW